MNRNKALVLLLACLINAQMAYASISNGFDYPVGKPDSLGFYDAQDFGRDGWIPNKYHLGEDWNKSCQGNCDKDESVTAISAGVVKFSEYKGLVWGNVIIIEHILPNNTKVYSQYGHLNKRDVLPVGSVVKRGDRIGSIRDGVRLPATYMWAHLHFELRTDSNSQKLEAGSGYSATPKPSGWLDPSDFIDANRPLKSGPITLQASNQTGNAITLNWNKPTFANFDRYEIYRSNVQNGTSDPLKRTNILIGDVAKNIENTSFTDSSLSPNTTYYYSLYAYAKNGLYINSTEISTKTATGIKNITNNPFQQNLPKLNDRYIVWQDGRLDERRYPYQTLFGYDLKEDKEVSFQVAITGSDAPITPSIYAGKAVYSAMKYKNYNGDLNIYLYDIEKQTGFAITNAPGHQHYPQIHKNIVVWEDHNRLVSEKTIDICYIDLDDGFTGPVCLNLGPKLHVYPTVWEKKIAYKETTQGVIGKDIIKVYDIETKQTTVIPGFYKEATPMISDGKVIFNDFARDLYIYDLNTQSLNKYSKYVSRSIIKQGKVIYFTWENNLGTIRLFDPENRSEKTLVSGLKYLLYFDYENGTLVYSDQNPSSQYLNLDIFMVKI